MVKVRKIPRAEGSPSAYSALFFCEWCNMRVYKHVKIMSPLYYYRTPAEIIFCNRCQCKTLITYVIDPNKAPQDCFKTEKMIDSKPKNSTPKDVSTN